MSGLPEGWIEVHLSDVSKITTGSTPPTKDASRYYGGSTPFVKPSDLDRTDPITFTEQGLTKEGVEVSRPLRAGSVLVSCIGNLGKVGIAAVPVVTNQQINGIEFEPQAVVDRYGYHYCRTLRRWMEEEASATTIAILNKGRFLTAPFILAPLDEQRRIAEKLDVTLPRVDACRARLDRVTTILKRFRQSVLAAATSGLLTEDWRALHGRSDDWSEVRLDEIADIQGGITKDSKKESASDEEIPYLRVANVQRGFIDLGEIKTIRVPAARIRDLLLEPGDILFNEGGDIDKLGRGWIWEGQIDRCTFQNHVFRARLFSRDNQPKYISWWGNFRGLQYFLRSGKQTTNLASINKSTLCALPISLPSSDEQAEIVRRVESLFSFADRLEASLATGRTKIDNLTPALLAKAFRGELVPQDPTDEPADVLLERIRAARESGSGTGKKKREATATGATARAVRSPQAAVVERTTAATATEPRKRGRPRKAVDSTGTLEL